MKRAVYAGSFDPPTRGHEWMISEGSRLFDELIVAIGINPDKKPLFNPKERESLLRSLEFGPNVRVDMFHGELLVHYAKRTGAQYILRGIRSVLDYDYERAMRNINLDQEPNVETVFLMPPRHLGEISSSLVKGLVGLREWEKILEPCVSTTILNALKEKKDV